MHATCACSSKLYLWHETPNMSVTGGFMQLLSGRSRSSTEARAPSLLPADQESSATGSAPTNHSVDQLQGMGSAPGYVHTR